MKDDHSPEISAGALWQTARVWAARVPLKAWIVLSLFLVAAILMAVHTAAASKDASLRLKVQHSFRSAQLSVWVDGDLAYSGRLVGAAKKKFGLIPDSVQGTLSETLSLPSGTRQVRVRVAADDGSVQEDTITGEVARNTQRTLSVIARHDDVSLTWQSATGNVAESASPSAGWFSRYAGSLLLTAAGSILSALAGFALRELPKHIASRVGEAPKV
jgi:hypothetical protein